MSADINEVRERLGCLAVIAGAQHAADLRALLADHARLVEEARNLAMFHWLAIKSAGGESGVFIPNRAIVETNWGVAEITRDDGLDGVTLRATYKKAVQT